MYSDTSIFKVQLHWVHYNEHEVINKAMISESTLVYHFTLTPFHFLMKETPFSMLSANSFLASSKPTLFKVTTAPVSMWLISAVTPGALTTS
ncbi:hypothetical protein Hanom_Chr03g00227431 [Helianthus anomalus]